MDRKVALESLLRKVSALGTCLLDVSKSENYVLASSVFAQIDLPSFNKSAMDGYAICKGEKQKTLQVADFTAAGYFPSNKLTSGKAVKILTGAPVPLGTWKVIPKELVIKEENAISFNCDINKSPSNICLKGEDIKIGKILYPAGTVIDTCKRAAMVFAGVKQVEVFTKPSIAVLTTGSEIVSINSPRDYYEVYNANAELLSGLLRHEIDLADYSHIVDDYSSTEKIFCEKMEKYDFLIFTGGASVGKFDYVKKMLNSFGAERIFSDLSIRPARPTSCYMYKNKLIFSLPGNPVAVFLAYHLFVLPVIYQMQNIKYHLFREVNIDEKIFVKQRNRENFVPIKYKENKIEQLTYNGPADLYHLSFADGFLVVSAETKIIENKATILFFTKPKKIKED